MKKILQEDDGSAGNTTSGMDITSSEVGYGAFSRRKMIATLKELHTRSREQAWLKTKKKQTEPN